MMSFWMPSRTLLWMSVDRDYEPSRLASVALETWRTRSPQRSWILFLRIIISRCLGELFSWFWRNLKESMEWILNRFGSLWCKHSLELVSLHLIFRLAVVSGDLPDKVGQRSWLVMWSCEISHILSLSIVDCFCLICAKFIYKKNFLWFKSQKN